MVIEGESRYQETPPSCVPAMTPPSPTAHPSCVPAKDTPSSTDAVTRKGCHEVPPSKVLTTRPFAPTAHPVSGVANWTSMSSSDWPTLPRRDQLVPPLMVTRIVPFPPTAQPSVALVNHTAFKLNVVPLTCRAHVAPASEVWRMVPPSPTTQPFRPSDWKNTPFRFTDVELVWRAQAPLIGSTVTSALSRTAPTAAISQAVPSLTPRTRPPAVTVNTRASLLSQVTATGVGFPSVSYTVALNCAVAPTFRVSTAGLMAIESTAEPVTGGASGAFSQDEARQARTTRAARSFHEVRRGCMRL